MRTLEQQIALLDKIREASRGHLNMEAWHSKCVTNHCLAEWAEVLNEEPTEIEDAEEFLLPDFAKFFHDKRAGKYLEKYLEARAYALAEGEVVKHEGLWIDRDCNFYSGELPEDRARRDSLTNKNCKYCTYCAYCTGCTECTDCTYCTGCTECTDCAGCIGGKYCTECTACKYCIGCKHCTGCMDCTYCAVCTDCTYCAECTDCAGCKYCTRCKYCTKCIGCIGCRDCIGCTGCKRCTECTDCTYCIDCIK